MERDPKGAFRLKELRSDRPVNLGIPDRRPAFRFEDEEPHFPARRFGERHGQAGGSDRVAFVERMSRPAGVLDFQGEFQHPVPTLAEIGAVERAARTQIDLHPALAYVVVRRPARP